MAQSDQDELEDALLAGCPGVGGPALVEAVLDGSAGGLVGEEKMLDDLLDAPFFGGCICAGRTGTKLRLGGVEAVESLGERGFQTCQDGIHSRQSIA